MLLFVFALFSTALVSPAADQSGDEVLNYVEKSNFYCKSLDVADKNADWISCNFQKTVVFITNCELTASTYLIDI